jgi:hypothetical protein
MSADDESAAGVAMNLNENDESEPGGSDTLMRVAQLMSLVTSAAWVAPSS